MKEMKADSSSADQGALLFAFFTEVGIISQLSSALFENVLPEGLNQSQFQVLNWFIRVDTEATPGRLAKAFQVTGGAMTNTLKKLESKQLVKIEPDPDSGRKKRVTITPLGREMRDRAIGATTPLLVELCENLDAKKILSQIKALSEVREYLDSRRYDRES